MIVSTQYVAMNPENRAMAPSRTVCTQPIRLRITMRSAGKPVMNTTGSRISTRNAGKFQFRSYQ